MAQSLIPAAWLKDVCARLEAETGIDWSIDGRRRFETEFSPLWTYHVYPALLEGLSGAPKGCKVEMGPLETWEFLFRFKGEQMYGKIKLLPGRKKIKIFSAHKSDGTVLSCGAH